MAAITITVASGTATTRVLDAIAAKYGYNAATDGTKADFAKAWIIKTVKAAVREHEANQAAAAAAITAGADADVNIVIT